MAFNTPATRRNARLRVAIDGPSGSGKTYSSLLMAAVFGHKIGLIDSERGSSQKYAGLAGMPEFFAEDLSTKRPQEYIEKIREAAAAGVDVLIIDSYSHSWVSALEMVDQMGGSKFSNGWKAVSPLIGKLVDTILSYPGHVIATMRSKSEYVIERDANGKNVPRKVGMAPVARDGTEFEFDVVLDLTNEGGLSVSKTRCPSLNGEIFQRTDVVRVAQTLKDWLAEGAPLSPRDALAERIRFASTQEELNALIPGLKALPREDLISLRAIYDERKRALTPT